jgi:hypothetical protein
MYNTQENETFKAKGKYRQIERNENFSSRKLIKEIGCTCVKRDVTRIYSRTNCTLTKGAFCTVPYCTVSRGIRERGVEPSMHGAVYSMHC